MGVNYVRMPITGTDYDNAAGWPGYAYGTYYLPTSAPTYLWSQGLDYAFDDNNYAYHTSGEAQKFASAHLGAVVPGAGLRGVGWTPIHRCHTSTVNADLYTLLKLRPGVTAKTFGGYALIQKSGAFWEWKQGTIQSMYISNAEMTNLAVVVASGAGGIAVSEARVVILTDYAPNAPAIISPVHLSVQASSVTFNWTHSDPETTAEQGFRVVIFNDYAVTGGLGYGAAKIPSFTGYANPYAPTNAPLSTAQAYYDSGVLVGAHGAGITVNGMLPGNYWAYINTSDGIGNLGLVADPASFGLPSLTFFRVFGANQKLVV